MKQIIIWLTVISVAGCTTLQPVAGTPADLQQRLSSGALAERGNRVLILTSDGRTHEFKVTSHSASTLAGEHESVPIDQVIAVQKREVSVRKTALAVGLTVAGVAVAAALVVGIQGAGAAAILGSTH